jgi:8-oxo-dGTP pyrophosphatase MutT (NUDIX family)
MAMLDFDPERQGPIPLDAATLVVIRDVDAPRDLRSSRSVSAAAMASPPTTSKGIEVFCVERSKQSGFLGGALVFPGGKLDPSDLDPSWKKVATSPRETTTPIADDETTLRGLSIAACREALEEAALLPVAGGILLHEDLVELRQRMTAKETTLRAFLEERWLLLDLGLLQPFARWVTPLVESRRYDTRFFLVAAPPGQLGAHDDHETTSSFWASPSDVLARFVAGTVQVAPPTHRTLELLSNATSVFDAFQRMSATPLDVICPQLVRHVDATTGAETMALVLPGDPEHGIPDARVAGASRFVLRDGRWLPEAAPPAAKAP